MNCIKLLKDIELLFEFGLEKDDIVEVYKITSVQDGQPYGVMIYCDNNKFLKITRPGNFNNVPCP